MNIHNKVLHTFLMDSGASHNIMPKIVMEELGLDIMKEYHDLYSFDSRKEQCLGFIKDLVVTLFQLPMKSVVMDIVVVNVPQKFKNTWGNLTYGPHICYHSGVWGGA